MESEGRAVSHSCCVVLIDHLEEELLVPEGVAGGLTELAEGYEIIRVNAVEGLQLRGECSQVKDEGLNLDLATEGGL